MINKTISYDQIIERLGASSMGIFYKADDTKLKNIEPMSNSLNKSR